LGCKIVDHQDCEGCITFDYGPKQEKAKDIYTDQYQRNLYPPLYPDFKEFIFNGKAIGSFRDAAGQPLVLV
jgi:hypothetical protein